MHRMFIQSNLGPRAEILRHGDLVRDDFQVAQDGDDGDEEGLDRERGDEDPAAERREEAVVAGEEESAQGEAEDCGERFRPAEGGLGGRFADEAEADQDGVACRMSAVVRQHLQQRDGRGRLANSCYEV